MVGALGRGWHWGFQSENHLHREDEKEKGHVRELKKDGQEV